jgi:dGTPase
VHDLEDGIVSGHVDLAELPEDELRDRVVARARSHYLGAGEFELDEVYGGLVNDFWRAHPYSGGLRDQAALKDLASELIGRFCASTEAATRARYGDGPLARYDADLVVPGQVKVEIAVLKAIAAVLVMDREEAVSRQRREREMLGELVDALVGRPDLLEPAYRQLYEAADGDAAALRVVVDQVACLTDAAAWGLHARTVRS